MKVKVWNDNQFIYEEEFKGEKISIKPHEFILMERSDAILFKGTMNPVKVNGDGIPLPESYKMIRIEQPSAKELRKMKDMDEDLDKIMEKATTE